MAGFAEVLQTGSAEEFAKRKQRVLKGLLPQDAADKFLGPDAAVRVQKEAANIKPDRSLKGSVDALLVPLCELLNTHPDYVTTSCCSGRITAYQQARTATGKRVKSGGHLVYVSHEPVDVRVSDKLLQEILQGCRHYPEKKTEKEAARGEAAFPALSHTDLKFEPLILHVEAATQAAALVLLRVAVAAGLRESGISALGKRNLVAIRGSQRMEAPITLGVPSAPLGALGCTYTAQPGVFREEETVLVTPAYFSSLLFLCNEKLKCNERQLNRLYEALQQELAPFRIRNTEDPSSGQRARSPAQRSAHPARCNASPAAASSASDANSSSNPNSASAAEAATDKFVGVREARHLKAVKSALEALGLFDKSRKMQQVDLGAQEEGGASSVMRPHPPQGTSYLKLLPVRGPVSLPSLPVNVRDSVVLSAAAADQLQLFSSPSAPNSPPCKQSIAECLDALLRSACESTAHGRILLEQALQLRDSDAPLYPATGDAAAVAADAAAAAPAAGKPLVSWPHKFEKVGDVILLPSGSLTGFYKFSQLGWSIMGAAQMAAIEARVWRGFCEIYGAKAVGVQAAVAGRMRESRARLVFGSSGLTTVKENGVLFTFDVTRCMFASGNGTERLRFRMSLMRGEGPLETVVDLFCGIGYFSLGAASFVPPHRLEHIYACDINPNALQCFQMSLAQNRVDPSRITFLLCDSCWIADGGGVAADAAAVAAAVAASDAAAAAQAVLCAAPSKGSRREQQRNEHRKTAGVPAALVGKVDRVCLGLIPSSEEAWPTAVSLLNESRGGILHIHGVAPLEAVAEEEAVCCTLYVHPSQRGEAATSAPHASDFNRKIGMQIGGNCKLVGKLRFAQHALKQVAKLVSQKTVKTEGPWEVSIQHVEKVKSYAPKLFHFVVDVAARPSSVD
ncbi:hypothetical protein Esti_004664 [Eimeria stiedai]